MDDTVDYAAESSATHRLLAAVQDGDRASLEVLLARHRAYLRRLIDLRLDVALQARVDPSDIVQETLTTVSQRIDEFLTARPASFRVWLRGKALDRLIDARRRHLRGKRDARREQGVNDASSMAIAGELLGRSPSEQLIRKELLDQVRQAMESLSPGDREILLLRNGEHLTAAESAEALGISPVAASKRFGRAVMRLSIELRRRGVTGR